MRRKTVIHISSLILILFFSVADICAEEYYFVTLEYPPLEFKDKTGIPKGIAVEIVTKIMNGLGHSVSIEVLPWARALKMVKHGRADAIFTIFKNAERELFLDYSSEILIPQMVAFFVRKDSPFVYEGNLGSLEQHKIGVVSTISYGQKFDSLRPALNIERTASLELNFKKLMFGRIELVISNVYSANIAMNKLNIQDKIKRLEPPVESVPSFIAFSKMKKLTKLQKNFDRKLIELKKSGAYDQIINKSGLKIEINNIE